jgi:hypothetical protein
VAGEVAEGVGPEFKPWYCKTQNNNNKKLFVHRILGEFEGR